MKSYATLLNLDHANEHSLKKEDVYAPLLQKSILCRMIWGHGETESESLQNAIKNLIDEGIVETYECEVAADEIVKNNSGKDALRHLWLHDDEYGGNEPKLFAVPCHETLVDFCDRYRLPEEAMRELALYFDGVLHLDM